MFIIFLHDFGMIWLELTQTDAIFSTTTMVLFLCRNKSSRNALKINGDFSGKYKKYRNEELPEGSPVDPTSMEGAPLPRGLPVGPPELFSAPTSPINPQTSRK